MKKTKKISIIIITGIMIALTIIASICKRTFSTCKVYRNEKYGTRQYGDIISRKHGRTYYGFSKVRSCSK